MGLLINFETQCYEIELCPGARRGDIGGSCCLCPLQASLCLFTASWAAESQLDAIVRHTAMMCCVNTAYAALTSLYSSCLFVESISPAECPSQRNVM